MYCGHSSHCLVPHRMCNKAPEEEYVKMLDFRHFSRHMHFFEGEENGPKKRIENGVNVSVVMKRELVAPKIERS